MPLRILTFSTLYPDSTRPRHGIFVETRLRHLLARGTVECRVVAPVPWFPLRHRAFGRYARFAAVPRRERRNGIEVSHPRYPLPPRVGMSAAPYLLAWGARREVERLRRSGFDFDLIDAHYFYPDGVAATFLGAALGRPVVITARGTDLNLIPRYRWPRRLIARAAREAAGLVTVCRALKDVLLELGVPDGKVRVLRNGVDLELFRPPQDRDAVRASLGMRRKTVLSVGYLVPRKGHDLVIRAVAGLPDVDLVVIGEGPERGNLSRLIGKLGLETRVRLLDPLDQRRLAAYYGASDLLVLASDREGWANVLLESMACGTPVVATRLWGTPEVVAEPAAGLLVDERTPDGLAAGIRAVLARPPDRGATRRYAEGFDWEATTSGQLALFEEILADSRGRGAEG